VLEATSGVEALEIWRDAGQRIHLLLTDIVMPGGVGGQEVARQLREAAPDLKVVFTSGYSVDIARHGITLAHGQIFLQKPVAMTRLLGAVRDCLDDRKSG
jgi:CheY-like chemotaxis protein